MSVATLICFVGASIALTVAPGPDNIFIITQGISRGRRAAITTALGMCSGISVHTTAAAVGISAVFYSSAVAFQFVKFAGAAYLLYLAYKSIKENSILINRSGTKPADGLAYFRRGFIMNVVNPKVALFFLAFLPQFTTKETGNVGIQMVVLGFLFMIQAVLIFSAIAYFSGTVGDYLTRKPAIARYLSWLTAGIFGALGLRLAFSHR